MRPAATPERTSSSQLRGEPGQAGRNSRRLPPSPWRSAAPKRGACSRGKSRPNSPRRRCRPASRHFRRQVPAGPEASERLLQVKQLHQRHREARMPLPITYSCYFFRLVFKENSGDMKNAVRTRSGIIRRSSAREPHCSPGAYLERKRSRRSAMFSA